MSCQKHYFIKKAAISRSTYSVRIGLQWKGGSCEVRSSV